ncbi:hypothetical protein B0T21DRAFT_360446 [Apiosordaria backusii]|uniref:ribonuclease H n=1 Tax=Apiosordaria backusii TaxID=314023 RepID=A0AA40EMD3_9PEZI|nr:hypothetical protein B0T21DRAFT_360446 [Apiosordaria backusii]
MWVTGLPPNCCPICDATTGLRACGGCRVISYCGPDHQSSHRSEHKTACNDIKKTREKLEREEASLRANPGDVFLLPADVFNTSVGSFWGILGTRDYMRARNAAAHALLQADTRVAVKKALDHFLDMLRLCRSDNFGVRDIIPSLLLRLDREQECYDFLKWWATADLDGRYNWGDPTLPYLDIQGADVFEPVNMFSKHTSLPHLAMAALLKLCLYLDLEAYETAIENGDGEPDRPVGNLVRTKVRTLGMQTMSTLVERLKAQYHTLIRLVNDANPYFWSALVESEGARAMPSEYSPGSPEEADVALYYCGSAWEESEDAMVMIEADTSEFVRVYEAPIHLRGPEARPQQLSIGTELSREKRRGRGDSFPSAFKPPRPTCIPEDLFHSAFIGHGRCRIISLSDPKKVLVYVDGACLGNGQTASNPRAGWAVVYGPEQLVSGRLENEGPFGGAQVATSNRAELRAAIAALRLCDWRADGFDNICIATDSSYVVDGATGWIKGWVRNGWKTRTNGQAKNKDLWELLLGEVERWSSRGLRVEFWKIGRQLNVEADAIAKKAAQAPAVAHFRDLVIENSSTAAGISALSRPRILTLCFEYEDMFNDLHADLISQLSSKATMERSTTPENALQILNQEPPPSIIFVADGGLARQKKVWERVIDRLREGATVIVAGHFSSFVSKGEFDRFFARVGLPWRLGSYHRETVTLHRTAVGDAELARRLPDSYSQKAVFADNVSSSDAWYTRRETSREAAVALARVGSGRLGYVGDVNGEEKSKAVVLPMCGLL